MRGDARSRRVVVLPDVLLNPPDGDTTTVDGLVADGWGLVVLPPAGLDPDDEAGAIDAIADQLAEFAQAGYALATLAPAHDVERLEASLGITLTSLDR